MESKSSSVLSNLTKEIFMRITLMIYYIGITVFSSFTLTLDLYGFRAKAVLLAYFAISNAP